MRGTRLALLAAFGTALLLTTARAAEPELAARLLVVFNADDPDSAALARHYAGVRGIPPDRVVGLPCPQRETITRAEFNRFLRDPLLRLLEERQWMPRTPRPVHFPSGETLEVRQANGSQIWALALMRGIPLRIAPDDTVAAPPDMAEPMRVNAAAVDSELALLTFDTHPLSGPIPNPYYHEERSRGFNGFHADQLILVTRLDGPTAADARRLVDDAVATEALELAGRAYFDARGMRDPASGYTVGDEWIRAAAAAAGAAGLATALDDAEPLYAETEPWEDVALYGGWYTGNLAGPFRRKDFRLARGAVAYHIHSFSAETLRSPDRGWTGPLVSRGAAASMGAVYEPYLRMTPNAGVFFRGLLEGLTFAEAAYQSQSVLSWMVTMVGDPLYRPFPRPFLDTLRRAEKEPGPQADWVAVRMLRILAAQPGPGAERIATIARAAASRPSPVVLEETARLLRELNAPVDEVLPLLRQAARETPSPTARIRLGLDEAALLAKAGRTREAMDVYEALLAADPAGATACNVPGIALKYAASAGWTRLSPNLQRHLSPVQQPPAPAP